MDLARFLDLYLAESQEHLRALNQSLLALESGAGADAIEEAFRAAHTIKGMSATMGYQVVTDIAHELENVLADIRSGVRSADAALVDDLLARTDALERSVAAAVVTQSAVDTGVGAMDISALVEMDSEAPAPPTPILPTAPPRPVETSAPPGTDVVARVKLRDGAQLLAARALIARRNAERIAIVLGSAPEEFGDDFAGEFRLFIGAGADREELEKVIRAAGDIDVVEFEAPVRAPAARAAAAEPKRARTVRVDQSRIDDLADGVGELSVLRTRLEQLLRAGQPEALYDLIERMRRLVDEVQDVALAMRMVPVGDVFDRFPRMVRDAARSLGKDVEFRVEGRDIELDRSVLDEIADPLVHLLRNSVDHGLESPGDRERAGKPPRGQLTLRAESGRASVRISVQDDGRGVNRARVREKGIELGLIASDAPHDLADEELLRLMGTPGFSTASQITDVSGRGVGMDAVLNRVRALGGAVEMRSVTGEGTTFTLVLPVTLAMTHSLRVQVADEQYAIPLTHVAEVVDLGPDAVRVSERGETMIVRDEEMPLVRLPALLGQPSGGETAAVIAEAGDRRTALAVDALIVKEQIVVKAFDPAVGTLPFFSGVTLLADGRPALVLDPISVS